MLETIETTHLYHYGLVVLMALSLGSFAIARHIHIRYLMPHLSLMESDAFIKSLIVVFGAYVIPWKNLFSLKWIEEIIGVVVGIIFGLIIIYLEVKMIRKANRFKLITKKIKPKASMNYYDKMTHSVQVLSLSSPKFISEKGLAKIRNNYARFSEDIDIFNYSLLTIVIVAISEEYLFRGYLIFIAHQIKNNIVTNLIMIAGIILFSCSHFSRSWNDVKYKIPLSLITTLEFIMTKTLLSAIITHALLNLYAYYQKQKWINT